MGWTTRNLARPGFISDHHGVVRNDGRQIDWDAVPEDFRTTPGQTVTAAATAQGATTLNVAALKRALPSGTVLDFGTDEFARTTADAAAGATTVSVTALVSALEGGETAVVKGSGRKAIPGGTAMTEIAASGKVVPRVKYSATDISGDATLKAKYLNAEHAEEPSSENTEGLFNAKSGYGMIVSASVYEDLLPDKSDSQWAAIKAELEARSMGFSFEPYSDNRAS